MMLCSLCAAHLPSGLVVRASDYCSGFESQLVLEYFLWISSLSLSLSLSLSITKGVHVNSLYFLPETRCTLLFQFDSQTWEKASRPVSQPSTPK